MEQNKKSSANKTEKKIYRNTYLRLMKRVDDGSLRCTVFKAISFISFFYSIFYTIYNIKIIKKNTKIKKKNNKNMNETRINIFYNILRQNRI